MKYLHFTPFHRIQVVLTSAAVQTDWLTDWACFLGIWRFLVAFRHTASNLWSSGHTRFPPSLLLLAMASSTVYQRYTVVHCVSEKTHRPPLLPAEHLHPGDGALTSITCCKPVNVPFHIHVDCSSPGVMCEFFWASASSRFVCWTRLVQMWESETTMFIMFSTTHGPRMVWSIPNPQPPPHRHTHTLPQLPLPLKSSLKKKKKWIRERLKVASNVSP